MFNVDGLDTPLFDPLWPVISRFVGLRQWPGPKQYNRLAEDLGVRERFGLHFSDVTADGLSFEERIAQRAEVQCREQSWHDFFNAMTTVTFPRTKLAINKRQTGSASGSLGRRDTAQNMLAHFEECGVVVLSANPDLSEHLRGFRWKELFCRNRAAARRDMRFIIYGHGLYAKALEPYIGFTGHGIIIPCDPHGLDVDIADVDGTVAELLDDCGRYRQPKDLAPIPLLGIPGWYADNEHEAFYENTSYFRSGRRGRA